ncbi:MAG: hypothetical protein WDO06_03465 [Actinomycetota bacterium]
MSIPGLQVGKWLGKIVFTDISGTHASSSAPVSFEILPSATATPTPTPTDSTIPTITPTPTPTPSKQLLRSQLQRSNLRLLRVLQ